MRLRAARLPLLAPLALSPLLASCGDSTVGSIFDPGDGGNGGPGNGGGTTTAPPIEGGLIVTGDPDLEFVSPDQSSNVSVETPIAALFTETIDASGVTLANFQVRPQGGVPVTGTLFFFAGNRLVVFVPTAPLAQNTTFEVVLGTGIEDLEGKEVPVPVGGVVATFATELTSSTNAIPSVVAVFPPPDATNVPRTTDIVAVFSEPVNTSTVWPAGLVPTLPGPPVTPVPTLPNFFAGNRIAVLHLLAPLPIAPTGALVALTFFPTIQNDDFSPSPLCPGPTPCLVSPFRVTTFDAPLAVRTASTPPDVVNRANLAAVPFEVDVGTGSLASDQVHLLVHEASVGEGLEFTEPGAVGVGTVAVSGDLEDTASPLAPILDDGTLVVGAYVRRGSQNSVIVLGADARQDTVAPSIVRLGPPDQSSLSTFATDLRRPRVLGTATEPLASVVVNGPAGALPPLPGDPTITNGTFFISPAVDLGPILAGPLPAGGDLLPLSLDVTDLAGNATNGVGGAILARGFTGEVPAAQPAGTVLVAVYDEASLQGLTGARVFLEPGLSQNPPSGVLEATVFSSGVYAFAGVPAGPNTVTAIAPGFDLATVVGTSATFLSIGLSPQGSPGAEALLAGSVSGNTPGVGIRFASNVLPDRASFGTFDFDPVTPNAIPPTAIRAGRPQVLSAFATSLPPTTTFFNFTIGPFLPPPDAGDSSFVPLVFPIPPSLTPSPVDDPLPIQPPQTVDLSGASGLDVANLVASPSVLVNGESRGFPGTVAVGLGFTSPAGPSTFTAFADAAPSGALLVPLAEGHLAVQAQDDSGAVSEARVPLLSLTGTVALPPVPTLTSPAPPGPFPPSLSFAFADTLAGSGAYAARIVDSATTPRTWRFLVPDGAGASVTVQVPVLALFPNGGVAGLATGPTATWTFTVDAHGFPPAPPFDFDHLSLSDLGTRGTRFSRSPAVTVGVQ
ncbi:MAG: Ig-like domain-containing protein [Planctomycetes bacterium]|nr:Ig-like domain-containing protein [Planctomycetota bacterium]